jgi:spore coat protein H
VRQWLAVLILACSLSAESPALAQGPVAGAAKPVAASSAEYYRIDEVQAVYLQVADADLERMRKALPERILVRASFRWREQTLENVAVRFKGNSSSHPLQQHKRGYLIKFNEYDSEQRFLGLRRVSFDNGVQFGSLFSEPIITEILRDQGVRTHRCNYAKLYLNGRYQGVYVNVERIDETFLASHLPDPQGLLFKVDEGGPGANLQFLGNDPAAYQRAFEPETKSAKKNQQPLVDFIRLINQSKEDELAANLQATMELDDFLKTTAVMLLAGAFDQLTGWNTHNYYLYYDGKHDRWRYLPWDLDVGFSEVAFGRIQVLNDWHAAWPLAGQLPNPLLERIVADPGLLKKYREQAQRILEKHFEPERLCALIDARYALIKDDLRTDPFPPRRVTVPTDRSYDDVVASMKQFVRKRYTLAHEQLKNPGPRPALARPVAEGPLPQIAAKFERIRLAAEQVQRHGGDVLPIQKLLRQVGPLLQNGKLAEAEKVLDEATKLVTEANRPQPE